MVLVMDWTATWAPPPIGTPPTTIWRLVIGRSCTAASVISLLRLLRALLGDKGLSGKDFTKVRVGCEDEEHQYEREPEGGDPGDSLGTHRPSQNLLRRDKEQVPTVERQNGEQVEDGKVYADEGQTLREELHALRGHVTAHPDHAYRARYGVVKADLAGHQLPQEP